MDELEKILDIICTEVGVAPASVKSSSRKTKEVIARVYYCHYARLATYTLQQIAKPVNRDHSTVHVAIKKFKQRMKYEPKFRQYDAAVLPKIYKLIY